MATDLVRNHHIEPPWLSGTKVTEAHTFSEGQWNGHKAPSAHPGQTGVHQRTKRGIHIYIYTEKERERENLLDSIYANWMTHTNVHMYEHLGIELDVLW